jgi:hypothetical protein
LLPEVNVGLRLPGIGQVGLHYCPAELNHGRSTMMKFLATSNEDDFLTYEISDEALEIAAGNETAGNYTLAACTGLSVCPG